MSINSTFWWHIGSLRLYGTSAFVFVFVLAKSKSTNLFLLSVYLFLHIDWIDWLAHSNVTWGVYAFVLFELKARSKICFCYPFIYSCTSTHLIDQIIHRGINSLQIILINRNHDLKKDKGNSEGYNIFWYIMLEMSVTSK